MIRTMSSQDAFDTLKNFFETKRAAKQAMDAIKEGVEIGIVIGETVDCALSRKGDQPIVERRPAVNPDVVFHIKPESVYVLSGQTKDEIGDVGVNVLKEVLAGNITVQVPGKLINLVNRGYLDMLREGGAPVMGYLSKSGLSSLGKITSVIKKMKG